MATYNKILKAGLQASYDALEVKDANVLYFCTDTGKLYKGSVDFTQAVVAAASKPASPIVDKIYVLADTNTVETFDGTKWKVLSYPMATVVNDASDDVHTVSAKAVYTAIRAAVDGVTGGSAVVKEVELSDVAGNLKITKGDGTSRNVALTGVALNPTWDSAKRVLKIPVVGGTELEVNIGKDIFVDPTKENKYNAETKKIELFLNDDTKIEVPAADLIDIYTGENTNGAHVTVSGDNKISVDVVVDPVEGNKLQLTAAGLKVDLSEYNTATEVDEKVKVAKDAADAAQSKADANESAIQVINGEGAGSIKKAVADLKTQLEGGAIKEAKDAADAAQATANKAVSDAAAAQSKADANESAIQTINGEGEGSIKKAVSDLKTELTNGGIKEAKDAAAAAQAKADQAVSDAATAQSKADANETEIGKLAEAITWGTF